MKCMCIGFLLWSGLALAADPEETRPNIIVLLADDLGYGDLGTTGHPHIRTPHLDAMAAAGATFRNFYSPAQVCSPARAAMLTGRMPHRLGIYSFIGGSSGDLVHLPASEVTLPQLLRKSGYQTAHIGKWHNSLNQVQAKSEKIPSMNHYGFDHWFSSDDNAINLNKPNWFRNGVKEGVRKGYTADTVSSEAVRWLTQTRATDSPFIQFVHFYEPHWLVEAPAALVASYTEAGITNRNEATYYAAVSNVDRGIGQIFQAVEALGLAENTAIFFSSDHGPARRAEGRSRQRNYGRSEPFRGHKYGLWNGSIQVPGMVRWPGQIVPGRVIEEPASSLDWLPTLCEMTKTPLPDGLVLDGQSHLSLLRGTTFTRKKPLQWHHYNTSSQHAPNPNAVLRKGAYVICGFYDTAIRLPRASWKPDHLKRVKSGTLERFALYNIEADPKQESCLALTHAERFERMKVMLEVAHREMQTQAIGWNGVVPLR